MSNLRIALEKRNITYNKLTIKNNTKIIDNNYVLKKRNRSNIEDIYNYLKSRSFEYFPNLVDRDNEYDIYEYVEDIKEPIEQKTLDMMNLLSLLHNKTTYYKEVDYEDYKYIYEYVLGTINENYKYYNSLMDKIELQIYMSPASYLLARNISKIYEALDYCKRNIEKWYEIVKDKTKVRLVLTHNNLELDHYLKSDKPYFVSWDKSRVDMPINDLYVFYQKHYLDFNFSDLLKYYESKYPLLPEEKILFLIFISLPAKIPLMNSEYDLCKSIRRFLDSLYKTEILVTEYDIPEQTNKT